MGPPGGQNWGPLPLGPLARPFDVSVAVQARWQETKKVGGRADRSAQTRRSETELVIPLGPRALPAPTSRAPGEEGTFSGEPPRTGTTIFYSTDKCTTRGTWFSER